MPIEFLCPSCSRTLRTPDESAGKKAKCPQCGAIADVPGRSTGGDANPFGAEKDSDPDPVPTETSAPSSDDVNPYASPGTISAPSKPKAPPGELVHSKIDFEELLYGSWKFFTENIGPLALFGLVIFMINAALQVIGQIGSIVAGQLGEEWIIGFTIFNGFLGFFVQSYVNVASVHYILQVARYRDTKLGNFFGVSASHYFRGIGASIVLMIVVSLISMLVLAPAAIAFFALESGQGGPVSVIAAVLGMFVLIGVLVWLGLRWWSLCLFFIVDRDEPIMSSFAQSSKYMNGNMLIAALLGLVVGMAGGAFSCVTCYLGLILYLPYWQLIWVMAYLSATGQPYNLPVNETTRIAQADDEQDGGQWS